ncbi:MAG TPA: hypothetical protein VGO47_04875, partial [Chlamydiales bacterium]|nr:hypothetical protein [Chlamydiales bacterium]
MCIWPVNLQWKNAESFDDLTEVYPLTYRLFSSSYRCKMDDISLQTPKISTRYSRGHVDTRDTMREI